MGREALVELGACRARDREERGLEDVRPLEQRVEERRVGDLAEAPVARTVEGVGGRWRRVVPGTRSPGQRLRRDVPDEHLVRGVRDGLRVLPERPADALGQARISLDLAPRLRAEADELRRVDQCVGAVAQHRVAAPAFSLAGAAPTVRHGTARGEPSLATTETGVPFSTAVPATASTRVGSVSAFAFTPGRRLASERRRPSPACP